MLYSHIQIHNTNISGNIVNNNDELQWTNKRTHLFIKIYLSHFILERVMLVVCEKWVGDGDRLLYWSQVLLTIAALLPHLGWGCSNVGHWGPKALCLPLVLNSASCSQLIQAVCVLVIFLFNVHLLLLFFHLFTLVHLLIDSSVEGQYVTNENKLISQLLVVYYPHCCSTNSEYPRKSLSH